MVPTHPRALLSGIPALAVALAGCLTAAAFAAVPTGAAGGLPISTDGTDPRTWDWDLDGPIAAPVNHKVIYQDDYVQVMAVTILPGAAEPYHLHPYYAALVYDMGDRIANRDETGEVVTNSPVLDLLTAPGLPIPWIRTQPPQALHSVKNVGRKPFRLIRVDFKQGIIPRLIHPPWPAGALPVSDNGTDPRTWDPKLAGRLAAAGYQRVVFEDETVCIQALTLPPGAAEPFHTQPYPAVVIRYGELPAEGSETHDGEPATITREPGQGPFATVTALAPMARYQGRNLGSTVSLGIRIDFKHGVREPGAP